MTGLSPLTATLVVGVGGSLGAVARYRVDRALDGRRSTATVNVVGSFLLGVVAAGDVASTTALLAGTGFCGAFTTYSSFAVELGTLAADGDVDGAGRFGVGTLLAAIAAVLLGGAVGGLVT